MYIHTNLLMCTYMPILFSVSNITQRLYNISSPTVVKLLFSNRIEKCISKAFNVTRCLIFFFFLNPHLYACHVHESPCPRM